MGQKSIDQVSGYIAMQLMMAIPVFVTATETQAAAAVQAPAAIHSLPQAGITVTGNRAPRVALHHILVQLGSDTEETTFLEHARGLGLHKIKRLRGTNWYTMRIALPGVGPRDMAISARRLPGVLHAAADPILTINDQIPPRDPFYVDDPDPGADCDIIEDVNYQPEDLLDQWGLFRVGAEGAWNTTTGSAETVIAVIDSGIDFDHDDLWANIWTNPGEIAGNGTDDDGNGYVDDR